MPEKMKAVIILKTKSIWKRLAGDAIENAVNGMQWSDGEICWAILISQISSNEISI